MDQIKKQTIVVLVDNEAGVLSQVSRMFSRKGYNIESLAVGETARKNLSRITIEVMTDEDHIQLLTNQLRKLIPVHSVKVLSDTNEEIIISEMIDDEDTQPMEVNMAGLEDTPIAPAGDADFAEFDDFDFEYEDDGDLSPEEAGFSVIDAEDEL